MTRCECGNTECLIPIFDMRNNRREFLPTCSRCYNKKREAALLLAEEDGNHAIFNSGNQDGFLADKIKLLAESLACDIEDLRSDPEERASGNYEYRQALEDVLDQLNCIIQGKETVDAV